MSACGYAGLMRRPQSRSPMDACCTSRTGMTITLERLDRAALEIARGGSTAGSPQGAGQGTGSNVTGATGAPAGTLGDVGAALLDVMTAETEFKANALVLATTLDMARTLYAMLD